MMKDVEEKKITVTDEEKKKVDDALAKLKEVKDTDDVEAIKKAGDELSTAAQAIGVKMYQQEQAQKGSEGSEEQPKPEDKKDEGPIEGEVVDNK